VLGRPWTWGLTGRELEEMLVSWPRQTRSISAPWFRVPKAPTPVYGPPAPGRAARMTSEGPWVTTVKQGSSRLVTRRQGPEDGDT